MKKFFKKIGNGFVKFGRWIKNTAWVQPLLIVGGIFAIIFAIPHIVDGLKNAFTKGSPEIAYYEENELSWEGIEEGNSEVDKILSYLQDGIDDPNIESTITSKYGKKFFLNFVQEDCPGCKSNYAGFSYAEDHWGSDEFGNFLESEGHEFKIYNIFVDEADDNGDIYFKKYCFGDAQETNRYDELFTYLADNFDSYYNRNVNGTEANNFYKNRLSVDNFNTPTTFLIDFSTERTMDTVNNGISEIFFQYAGVNSKDDKLNKARTVWQAWNHDGVFSRDNRETNN